MENRISEYYLKKIRNFFIPDWILLFVVCVLLIYSLLSFFNIIDQNIFNISYRATLIFSTLLLLIFLGKSLISQKIRTRLICKINENSSNIILTVYNNSIIDIDKRLIPLIREPSDYFIDMLFANRWGTINLLPKDNKTAIVIINDKKYYLASNLFEQEVTI